MAETGTFGELRALLLDVQRERPDVAELEGWQALLSLTEQANPDLLLTEEALARANRLAELIRVKPPFPPAFGPCFPFFDFLGKSYPESS